MKKENQLSPEIQGLNTNLNSAVSSVSPGRSYMFSNMVSKSVVTEGNNPPKIMSGFEPQYANATRKVKVPCNMTVEKIFYVGSAEDGDDVIGDWETVYIGYKDEENGRFGVLPLIKYHAQNSQIAWEYVYDRTMMRRLKVGATFRKGEVFARSPRVDENNIWCYGTETKVAAMSSHMTEEDGIVVFESYAREKLRCTFKIERSFNWREDDYIPVYCYGTEEEPRPFPELGEKIRDDGVVMAFRPRNRVSALVSLTNKALREVDYDYDVIFRTTSTDCEVVGIEVISDRMKNRSNNRKTEFIEQPHTKILNMYEKQANTFHLEVIYWYNELVREYGDNVPMTPELKNFIINSLSNHTVDSSKRKDPINKMKRRIRLEQVADWRVNILIRQKMSGRAKFKLSGIDGDKGVIVRILPDKYKPYYEDGTSPDIIVNNTPAYRRQISSSLTKASVNFINERVNKEVVMLHQQDEVMKAYEKLLTFYETVSEEFANIVKRVHITDEDKHEHVKEIVKSQITVHIRSDGKYHGDQIVRRLQEIYKYKPQKVKFIDSVGELVESENPILITSMYYLLLDKFGSDASAQALPKHNLFGFPSSLNELDKTANFQRETLNRNLGEGESMLQQTQRGPKDIVKHLAMAYSPEIQNNVVRRILRADNPFRVKQIIRPEEYQSNRAVQMAKRYLSDAGYRLRKKEIQDVYIPPEEKIEE